MAGHSQWLWTSLLPKRRALLPVKWRFSKRSRLVSSNRHFLHPRFWASGCGTLTARPKPIPSATISYARACQFCAASSNWCAMPARTSCRLMTRICAYLLTPLCARAGARSRGEQSHAGGYEPIIDHLNRLKVHQLTMEFTAPQAGDMSVFRELRADLEIGLGCLDVTPGRIDSAETIASRVRQALKHLTPERITLNPDCGFAPGSGAMVTMDEAYHKLCKQSEAARLLRVEFGRASNPHSAPATSVPQR